MDELREYMDKLQAVHGRIQCQADAMHASSCLVFLSGDKASENLSVGDDLLKLDHLFE